MRLNIIVGRFQPLHNEHVRLIDTALSDKSATTIILIGSSVSDGVTNKNPFTFIERRSILTAQYFQELINQRLQIFELPDCNDDTLWLDSIDKLLNDISSSAVKTFYVVDKDEGTTSSNNLLASRYAMKRISLLSSLSATHVRNLLSKNIFSKDLPETTLMFLKKKYSEEYTCDEIVCRACEQGLLLPKTEDRELVYLDVYTLLIKAPFLSCECCGASIINKSCRDLYKTNKRIAIERLFYN